MAAYISGDLRRRIDEADRRRCRYCLTAEAISGVRLTHDHIMPVSKGGESTFENVCLACSACNEHKSDVTHAVDPISGESVPLFHPRIHIWIDHFAWSTDATRIEGLTPVGRATVIALRLNHPLIVTARARWARVGWHPPEVE